ncbi:hypothetical protein JHN55_06845 [Streptomyces sp. MBT56]|uniref:hypothetical protein n=1 Tax=unclassified Streptomyces TaxID=2593676 RepID=UPI00190C5844|nr:MULTISPECIES: hypothetical protein [unclassified Streptomyces]MBK3556256.1 hypothetical protein [Streptomyces sp. MBT56]MBK3605285.1 hypothetical protein [Streptomyces sp. MBT54]MBK3619161.1 hypothetical protein [Streptomyces sp. MBT98]
MSSGTGLTDADGRPVPITVTVDEHIPATVTAGGTDPTAPDDGPASTAPDGDPTPAARIGIRLTPPAGELVWSCTPEAARRLAAELLRAAEEAENAPAGRPVTVGAGELRRGDVRDGDRAMTVESARTDGSTVHITWKSGAGRSWTQAYAADAAITLKRRLPEGR